MPLQEFSYLVSQRWIFSRVADAQMPFSRTKVLLQVEAYMSASLQAAIRPSTQRHNARSLLNLSKSPHVCSLYVLRVKSGSDDIVLRVAGGVVRSHD